MQAIHPLLSEFKRTNYRVAPRQKKNERKNRLPEIQFNDYLFVKFEFYFAHQLAGISSS